MEERSFTQANEYPSFVLPGLLDGLGSPPKKTILDLSQASGENVRQLATFSNRHCKLFFVDFLNDLNEAGPRARRDRDTFAATCEELLSFPEGTRLDLILAWDLFNYLELEEIKVLSQQLRRFCALGTKMMALVSILREMPDRPFRFFIRGHETLFYQSTSSSQRPSPRYNEGALVRHLPGFQVEKAMLLRNGMQEYAFLCEKVAPARPTATAAVR